MKNEKSIKHYYCCCCTSVIILVFDRHGLSGNQKRTNTPNDVKIVNGTARVIKVYDNATSMTDISASVSCIANGCVDNDTKEGSIHFEKGNVIVFEFVPKYGYQLTSVSMNGMPLTPQANANQYVLDTADANISLVLAEGVDGNDVAIVHEKSDGSCELITGTYDADTQTVSFATDGFSNYAIAYRTVDAPETGAFSSETNAISNNIITAIIIVAGFVIAFSIIPRKTKIEE